MFPTKSLCLARSPNKSVTTPLSSTATRVSSRATVIAISTPIQTPSVQRIHSERREGGTRAIPGSDITPILVDPTTRTKLGGALCAAIPLIKQTQPPPFHVQQKAKRGHGHDGRAPTIAHKRKRDADDREHARRHAYVDDHAKAHHRDDADRQQCAQLVLRARRNLQRQPDQRDE